MPPRREPVQCEVEGCARFADARGMCPMHYKRWKRNADPNVLVPHRDRAYPIRFAECHPDRKHSGLGLCKPCYRKQYRAKNQDRIRAQEKADRAKDPEKYRRYRWDYQLRSVYGITQSEWDQAFLRQGGRCAICKEERKLHVDHAHDTGQFRGLLCSPCNVGIGMLGDDPQRMSLAAQYVYASEALRV